MSATIMTSAAYDVTVSHQVLDEAIAKASSLGVAPHNVVLLLLQKTIASLMDIDADTMREHTTRLVDLYDPKTPEKDRAALTEKCMSTGQALVDVIHNTAKAMYEAKGKVKQ
jgi:hypothetical protein